MTSVIGGEQFEYAQRAGREVYRGVSGFSSEGIAVAYHERLVVNGQKTIHLHRRNRRLRRRIPLDKRRKALQRVPRAFCFHNNAGSGILRPSGKTQPFGELVKERAKAHALNRAGDRQANATHRNSPFRNRNARSLQVPPLRTPSLRSLQLSGDPLHDLIGRQRHNGRKLVAVFKP